MKIFCIGRNYSDHAKELNNPVPSEPVVFMKPPTALLPDNKPFYHPEFSNDIHHEVEVVIRIGKNGKHIQPQFADKYYDAISLGIDFTARDIQRKCKEKGLPWEKAKAFDHAAPIGPWINRTELPPSDNLNFKLLKNGEMVQAGNTKDMLFHFNDLISHLSKYFTLLMGDMIFTGTPAGVGPIAIHDQLEGYLEDRLMLQCEVR